MIIAKLADGSLWVNSPVSVPLDMLDRIIALGPVKYLVAPTRMHVWRLQALHALFPEAELWGPPQIPNQFKRLPFAGILGDAPPKGWSHDFDQLVFKGNLFIDEVFFFHKKSQTVILADFIQNRPIAKGKPFRNALFKLAGVAYPLGGVALDSRSRQKEVSLNNAINPTAAIRRVDDSELLIMQTFARRYSPCMLHLLRLGNPAFGVRNGFAESASSVHAALLLGRV
jgi:Domain of unknown function (DUF4336)